MDVSRTFTIRGEGLGGGGWVRVWVLRTHTHTVTKQTFGSLSWFLEYRFVLTIIYGIVLTERTPWIQSDNNQIEADLSYIRGTSGKS